MARLWSSGAELNSLTAGVEVAAINAGLAISNTVFRSGAYSWEVPSGVNGSFRANFAGTNQQGKFFFRVYLRIVAHPTSTLRFMSFADSASAIKVDIRISTSGTLRLFNGEDATQIGSDSSVLTPGAWYCVELMADTTTLASTACEAKIDGVTFASGFANLNAGICRIIFGTGTTGHTGLYLDDLAVNDTADPGNGQQMSWPGEGKIVHLRPNANGDTNDFTDLVGGGSKFEAVDEVTPDDDTSYVQTSIAGQIEEYNLDGPSMIGANDAIPLVQVGWRGKVNSGTAHVFVLRSKASSGGTLEETGDITSVGTGYATNAFAEPRNYPMTLYNMPGAPTTSITKAALEGWQIGLREVTDGSGNFRTTAIWLLVEYVPRGANAMFMGANF